MGSVVAVLAMTLVPADSRLLTPPTDLPRPCWMPLASVDVCCLVSCSVALQLHRFLTLVHHHLGFPLTSCSPLYSKPTNTILTGH